MKTINESNYVDRAEDVIKQLKARKNPKNGKPIPMVTTSKIRNLLAMSADIYNEVSGLRGDEIPEDCQKRIVYLRIRFVYEAGRDPSVKDFVESAQILDVLKEIGSNRGNYILFSRYMESLIAFHRYLGGKD